MSNIHSLDSTKDKGKSNRGHSSDDSDEGGDEDRQGFFVGGSTHSGQEVLGPSGRANPDFASRLFDAARNAGAEQLTPEEAEAAASSQAGGSSATGFQGGVYRLGGHGQPSESIDVAVGRGGAVAQGREAPVIVNFYVWTNGFSLDDGPLRTTDDPQNRPLLQAITRGEIPQELVERHPGRKIDFHLIRKQTEYVPPKAKPFGGEGHRLGAIVPNVVPETIHAPEVAAKKPDPSESEKLLKEAQEAVKVNQEEPTTRIQIRLPNAPPIVGVFNHTHTVQDLRNFVVGTDPTLAYRPFQFMTTYPSTAIEEEGVTLKEAGVLASALVVKFV